MNWTITAGILGVSAGLLTAAPTAADADAEARESAEQRTAGAPESHLARASGHAANRVLRDPATHRPGVRGTGRPADGTAIISRPPECHWWPYWPPFAPPVGPEDGNRNALLGANTQVAAPPVAVVTATTASSTRQGALSDPAAPITANAPLSPAPAVEPSSGGPMIPTPPPSPAPAGPPRPAPASSAPPAFSPTPPTTASRAPNLADVTAQALPGLLGLAALTGAGSLLGYRQAKAGFALHAAGTARFLPGSAP